MLQIDSLQHDVMIEIDNIIIQDENTTTRFHHQQLLTYDKQHLSVQFTSNRSYIMINNATKPSKCFPAQILKKNQEICVFQSNNAFLDG
eukprot:14390_1